MKWWLRAGNTSIDRLSPHQTENYYDTGIGQSSLAVNLSESFKQNASVSEPYADAVTGSKQIQMLG